MVETKKSNSPVTTATDFRTDIQGMRALAIGLVIADHMGLPIFHGGYVGVDVFFVISGFLITSHLLSQLARTGRIAFADFYARRMRRILPAALLVAAVTFVAGLAFMPPLEWTSLARMAVATALYVPNMLLAADGTDYLAGIEPSPFQHYWSLGVEEQFYLIWPAVLLLTYLLVRRSKRGLFVATIVFVVMGFVVSVIGMGVSAPWSFFSLPTRAWELGIGALAAFVLHRSFGAARLPAPAVLKPVLSWAGLAMIVLAGVLYTDATPFPGTAALLPTVGAAFLIVGGDGGGGLVRRLLSTKPLQYVGKISYSLYLWHWPLLVLPQAFVGLNHELPLWFRAVLMGFAVILAHLTFVFVEETTRSAPILTRGRPRRSILTGLAASVVVVLVAAVAIPASALAPLAGTTSAAAPTASTQPVFSSSVPSNVSPALDEAQSSSSLSHRLGCHLSAASDTRLNECVFGDVSSARSAVLFGDSHGGHWFAAVNEWATQNDYALKSYTKAGCSTVLVQILDGTGEHRPCTLWRDKVLDEMASNPPDLLVITNTSTLPFATHGLSAEDAWAEGVSQLIESVPAQTRVVTIANTPEFPESAPRCLSHRIDDAADCGAERSVAIDQDWLDAERLAFEQGGADYIDLNDYFCSTTWCGSIQGNVLMYRDASHITETWSTFMAGPLSERIRAIVP